MPLGGKKVVSEIMANSLDGSTPKKKNKYWLLSLLLIPLFCAYCYIELAFADELYYKRLVKKSPHLREVQLATPKLITGELADCTYDLSWFNENTLRIRDCETDGFSTIDIKTGKTVYEKSVATEDEETYVAIFEPTGKNKMIATCPNKNLAVHGGSTQIGKYEISLWEQEQAIATFPFSSEQWEDRKKAARSHSGFSPNCKYFYLVLYGDIDVEFYAQEELWLLDVQKRSFKLVLTGGRYPAWGDSPVQSVGPSWSPEEQEFVFGDSEFGLEIYNMGSGKRRFIVGPSLKPYNSQWSPAGKWIAATSYGEAEKSDHLILVSPNRNDMAVSTPCWLIGEFAWSQNGEQLAYTCSDASSHKTDSLWVWDVEK